MEMNEKTDEELEKIVSEGPYYHGNKLVAASQLEIDRRRSEKLYAQQEKSAAILQSTLINLQKVVETQEKISKTTASQLHKIINILNKPIWLVVFASIWGIVVGVIINVLTSYSCTILRCPN